MDSEKQAVYRIGLDVGSTTAKIVVLDKQGAMVYQSYRRHLSNVEEAVARFLDELQTIVSDGSFRLAVTGSVGLGLSERHQLPFVQEVVAAAEFTKQLHPDIRTIIDIGGEDAKIVYLQDGRVVDLRMNGNCAGGTGAFIDQMALCLGVEVGEMNGLALAADTVYPIASRCGVFSKTDIQNLIARNVSKQNIAASIFHAVAVQTASALSHGMEVKPKVLMCGGPLTFIPALRKAIAEYFQLDPDKDVLMEEHANVIPAWGTALSIDPSSDEGLFTTDSLRTRLATVVKKAENGAVVKNKTFVTLPPIFESEEDYLQWKLEKSKSYVKLRSLSDLPKGEKTYLGIDSGSTTTKIVLMGEQGDIYFTHYVHNGGNPIAAVGNGLELLDRQCRQEGIDLHITAACSTGYGEDLIKAAYSLDYGMIETMAHYMAARRICPEVSFILDIGGQDMKAIYVDNGVLTRMEINEACSSGCGSFIETFAQTLKLEIKEFVMKACESKRPSDLGTRCTVFMNSKVKQVLREGATVSDIAAGLAYSVVKNCLFKVLKLKNYDELGEHIVLQGGTMRNDSVVKAFENLTGRVVQCNNIPELMGAYGCALFARQKTDAQKTALPLQHYLSAAAFEQKTLGCHGCENQCRITRYTFNNGRHYFSGNKCERIYTNGSGDGHKGVNLSRRKYELLFDRARNTGVNSQGVTFGIPRALNMYEEFPFWHTFFTQCGFGVELSSDSTYARYEKGVHTVMSDNICFPAKLVHSHIYELDANEKVDRIFYPRVMFEEKEDQTATDSLNCPIVIGYPEVVHSSVKTVKPVDSPVISFADPQLLLQQLYTYLKPFHVDKAVIRRAHAAALEEMHRFGEEMRRINEETLARARAEKRLCMLLVGRPYHTDPLVQHKVSDMIASLGVDVLTEDVVRKLDMPGRESFALKQWTYVNRIQNAARWAAAQDHLVHMVQTTSF
ncbi:MAG: 2-hydroxyglutaryl-CoA dehydratase, partial [Paludibacteraceae bacterium]|nr:2-hydroxyglutaryl-CoA dehydratase [Paludibacteraceae bacterium]